ncbi:MAG TPA: pirin family protein [Paludibacter sp.]|nr:pirin family protein [Paludibacter sp.]
MENPRSIEKVLPPPPPRMVGDGFRVHSFFPGNGTMDLQRMSPFFLMDYGSKIEFPPTERPRGVGVHPHRGFETVTIAYHGKVAHHDSAGNSGVIGEGDVQWMTAASGVLHKEYHEAEWSKTGGLFQMVQLWVNLPARYKMSPPKYQAIKAEQYGHYYLQGNLGVVEIIAGEYNGVKGPASTFTPIEMYNARIRKDALLHFSFPQHFNTGCVVIEGSITANGNEISADHFALFANDGIEIQIKASQDSVILLLSGEPINEPVVPYGPFLMNTREEIIQAYEDLNNGKFGFLDN